MERLRIRVEGIVQGVGFRPFVYAVASRLGLVGSVCNDSQGVLIEAQGVRVEELLQALRCDAPPLALIDRIAVEALPPHTDEGRFSILASHTLASRSALISPDVATCRDCLRELFDPADRRYRYAFTNCTNCGPRYTIIKDVPYDRPLTTMAGFPMCADCRREYEDPADRRFHAQPVACPACGPQLRLLGREGDPLEGAARAIREGRIVAVKGLGGYHLAVLASHEGAVARLRSRKHREAKPFALMARDVQAARALAHISAAEEELLSGLQHPIVLLERLPGAAVAEAVAPGHASLGLLLPYTPLHHLLLGAVGEAIVLTSGNRSDEPIAYVDEDARERLSCIADDFLIHDRPIHIRTDDSVVRCFAGVPTLLRRSRGYAPQPIRLPWELERPVLACGGELKATICLARGRQAFLSHHLGDLENYETFCSFLEAIEHLQRLFDIRPEVVVCDLHPEYLSSKWARQQDHLEVVEEQHHYAHLRACLADAREQGPVIGVALDGLGYGPDHTLWGGEFLRADRSGYQRLGSLATMPMPGGAAAVRQPWRMAAVYLEAAFGSEPPELPVLTRHLQPWPAILKLGRTALRTSSMGRLFDAVAALLDVRDEVLFEGQAAVELEQLADARTEESYPLGFDQEGCEFRARGQDLVRAVVEDRLAGLDRGRIAGRFHNAVADLVVQGCQRSRDHCGLDTVALSGGVFQNRMLLEKSLERLERAGFRVLRHRQVPPNDGGLSLGQAVTNLRPGPGRA